VIANGLVYIGSRNGHVYALELEGEELGIVWDYDARSQITNSVAVTDRVVYVATTGGEVIAIAPVASERLAD
jgi:outer membrane protein assembly factor BamB